MERSLKIVLLPYKTENSPEKRSSIRRETIHDGIHELVLTTCEAKLCKLYTQKTPFKINKKFLSR